MEQLDTLRCPDLVFVFFNKSNNTTLITAHGDIAFNPDEFIRLHCKYNDPVFTACNPEDIAYAKVPANTYYSLLEYNDAVDANGEKLHRETQVEDIRITSAGISAQLRRRDLLLYGKSTYYREFTPEQVASLYNDNFINCNLRNMIKAGVVAAEFIPIRDLNVRTSISWRQWNAFGDNPYLLNCYSDKLMLGKSIIEKGTFYPFLVGHPELLDGTEDPRLFVYEGNHRIMSLKLASMLGLISDEFKVLCLHRPKIAGLSDITLKSPVTYNYILETVYGSDILTDSDMYRIAVDNVHASGERFLSDYIVESKTTSTRELMGQYHAFPIFMCRLLFSNPSILPHAAINNEEKFKAWLTE